MTRSTLRTLRWPEAGAAHSEYRCFERGIRSGTILVTRAQPGPFSERQIQLLKTFADQAVIAIENVRLFTELEARNRDLTEALEQQTATSEILRVISSSPTDVQPVFDIIAERATRLCGADLSLVSRVDGDLIHLISLHGIATERLEAVRRPFPLHRTSEAVTARTIRTGAVVNVPDVLADSQYNYKDTAQAGGWRGCLGVPMIRENQVIGAIFVARSTPWRFPDSQVDLLKTFADQAVIAIENVRLFTELEARNRDLTEALEQQTATSEILRVISGSPTDVQPVFDTIVRSAVSLCGGMFGTAHRFDGKLVHLTAHWNCTPEVLDALQRAFPMPPDRRMMSGRAILTTSVVHVEDLQADPEYVQQIGQAGGFRGVLAVPLLREGSPIGAIVVIRAEPGPFSTAQIELLKTFADQAVIAVENVRLFTELEKRNRDLTESLEQQTATSEILRVISSSPTDIQPVFDTIAQSAMHLCDAAYGVVARYDGQLLHLVSHAQVRPEGVETLRQIFPMRPSRATTSSRAILERAVVHVPDVLQDPDYARAVTAGLQNRSVLAVPMLRDTEPIGTISVGRPEPRPFTDTQISLLKTFADQAVIAIENVRLFTELEARNSDLTETLEQQTATSEILRVISSSPTDVQPVFDTIAANALRLCNASWSAVTRYDGEMMHLVSHHNVGDPTRMEALRRAFPRRPREGGVNDRAILTRSIAHVTDTEDPSYQFGDLAQATAYRSIIAVPMLRDGQPVGTICVTSAQAKAFSPRQVALLGTFADQAVIAIENVRLFEELEARNRDLTETLEQQTATGEILRVISSSPTNVQPVFDTIVESAVRLCDGMSATVYRFDGTLVHISAQNSTFTPEAREAFQRRYPAPPSRVSVVAQTILDRTVVHVRDFSEMRTSRRRASRWHAPPGTEVLSPYRCSAKGRPSAPSPWDGEARGEGPGRSPIVRYPCSRPSPTRPSSPSRTSGSSRSSRPETAISRRLWSSRRPPARSCGSSPARRPMSSPCSMRSCGAPCACAMGSTALSVASMAS